MVGAARPRETRCVLVVDVQHVPRLGLISVKNPQRRSRGDGDPQRGIVNLQPIGDPGIIQEAGSEFRLVTPRIPSDDDLLKPAFAMPSHRSEALAACQHPTHIGVAVCSDQHARLLESTSYGPGRESAEHRLHEPTPRKHSSTDLDPAGRRS